MSLPIFQATVVNDSGDIIPSPEITVVIESSGLPATLFSDRNGTVPLGTGGVFFGGVDGFAQFYAAPNDYRVTASDAGSGFSITWRYNMLNGTAALADTGLLTGNVPTADQLSMVGETVNYTGANLNPNVFGGVTNRMALSNGGATNATQVIFSPRVFAKTGTVVTGILLGTGTYSLYLDTGVLIRSGIPASDIVLSSSTGGQQARIVIVNNTGLITTDRYELRSESGNSTIEAVYV